MDSDNVYESRHMSCILGDTLRPGGYKLTERGVSFCGFSSGSNILDIGCGSGSTIEYLKDKYSFNCFGIDPSSVLLERGKKNNPELDIREGRGEYIPFSNESMDGIFAECTLSLMEDLDKTIQEAYRVLKKYGRLVITDVYARNTQYLNLLQDFSFNSCMRGLHDIENFKKRIERCGFKIMLFEDYTDLLKHLMVKIIFEYGSMNVFWSKAASCSVNCTEFQQVLSKCRVGYFLMIVKKEE